MMNTLLKPFKFIGKYLGFVIKSIVNFVRSKKFLQRDKLLHFFICMSIAALFITPIIGANVYITSAIVVVAAVGREMYGKLINSKNKFDFWDMGMSLAGGFSFIILYILNT